MESHPYEEQSLMQAFKQTSDVSSIKQHELNNQFLSLFASLLDKKES